MQTIWAEEVPAVVLGDFNVIPEDKDVWSVRAMASDALMQPESRDAYRRMLADGWTDAIDTLNPRGGVWTYWDYQAGAWQRDHGFRIDHLLLSPELADRMQAAGVDKEYRGREKAQRPYPGLGRDLGLNSITPASGTEKGAAARYAAAPMLQVSPDSAVEDVRVDRREGDLAPAPLGSDVIRVEIERVTRPAVPQATMRDPRDSLRTLPCARAGADARHAAAFHE